MSNKLKVVGDGARSCGDCMECCHSVGVHELDKPAGVWCEYTSTTHPLRKLPGKGCAIYDTRPESCREWSCAWLSGAMGGTSRPDRIGIVFIPQTFGDTDDGALLLRAQRGELFAGAREVFKGASAMPKGVKAIRWFTRRGVSVLLKSQHGEDWEYRLYPARSSRAADTASTFLRAGYRHKWNGKYIEAYKGKGRVGLNRKATGGQDDR